MCVCCVCVCCVCVCVLCVCVCVHACMHVRACGGFGCEWVWHLGCIHCLSNYTHEDALMIFSVPFFTLRTYLSGMQVNMHMYIHVYMCTSKARNQLSELDLISSLHSKPLSHLSNCMYCIIMHVGLINNMYIYNYACSCHPCNLKQQYSLAVSCSALILIVLPFLAYAIK